MTLRQVTLPRGTDPDGVDDGWTRPPDWLPLPTLVEGQQKLVLLMAVFGHEANFAAMTVAGAYTVDWGDGSAPVNYATGVTAARNIAYADATALTSRGYRQVLVTVTPQAGANLTSINLAVRSPTTLPAGTSTQWLDIALVSSTVTGLTVSGTTAARMLERFAYVGPSAITTINSGRFLNASALRRLVGTQWTASITSFNSMFQSCSSLQSIPALNTASALNFSSMFSACSSLQSIPALNTAAGTNFSSMFNACSLLSSIPALNTAAGTNFSMMFNGCSSLAVGALSGTRYSIDYTGCKLSAAQLNAIYTALGTAAGAQTITVTGNYGTTGDDPSIATAKGWTVTG